MSGWKKLFFVCLILGTIACFGVNLMIKEPSPWRRNSLLRRWRISNNDSQRYNWQTAGPNVAVRKGTNSELRKNINMAVFNCNPFWLVRANLDKSQTVYSCPKSKRTITVKSAYRDIDALSNADIIIFAAWLRDTKLWEKVVEKRNRQQIWVYSTAESAYFSPQIRDGDRPIGFGHFSFNMSFGYHSLSNVLAPFGEYRPFRDERKTIPLTNYFRKKKKLISWVSSHCDNQFWNRTGFVNNLAKLVPVDTYGACGNKHLPRGSAMIDILEKYKFNLALENSCCSEYISEKLWNSLADFQSVPIVVGPSKSDYERIAPPNSCIFASDFESLEDLSGYLRKLSRNPTLYNKYHEWRRHGDVITYSSKRVYPFTSKESACALLEFLERLSEGEEQLEMKFNPFGKSWLGSCKACGEKDWMRKFNMNPDAFNPTLRKPPEQRRNS